MIMVNERVKGKEEKELKAKFWETLYHAIDKGDVCMRPGTSGKKLSVALKTTLERISSGSSMENPSLSD